MAYIDTPHRRATPEDAQALAELVNIAGEGLPFYLWQEMTEKDGDPWETGRQRALRDSGSFSYSNAIIREVDGKVAAALIGYPLANQPAPANYSEMPPLFVPLQALEDMVPGTWYINVLATYPEHRGKGYGTALLKQAEVFAAKQRKRGLSIIVSDANPDARRLYERNGYCEVGRRAMVKENWDNSGKNWILLARML